MDVIKMKVLKDKYKHRYECCNTCGRSIDNVLDMYVIQFGAKNGHQITICDECNDILFFKTLKASVYTSTRLKQREEIKFSNRKFARNLDAKKLADMEAERVNAEKKYNGEPTDDEWEEAIEEYGD